jgi:hypothetical protein
VKTACKLVGVGNTTILLTADAVAAVIAEAATRAGLPRSEAERTAWSGIGATGGVAHA